MKTRRLRAWLVAATALCVVAGAAGATTFALFSDQKSSQADFQAGTLSVLAWRDQGDTIPGPLFYTSPTEGQTPGGQPGLYPTGYWAPGDQNTRVLHIENTGSLDGWLSSVSAQVQSGDMALAQALQVTVTAPNQGNPLVQDVVAQAPLSSFLSGQVALADAGGSKIASYAGMLNELRFTVSLPLSADNTLQGKELRVAFFVQADQMAHNP